MSAAQRARAAVAVFMKMVVGAMVILSIPHGAPGDASGSPFRSGDAISVPEVNEVAHNHALQPPACENPQSSERRTGSSGTAGPVRTDRGSKPLTSHPANRVGLSRNPDPEPAKPIPVATVDGVKPMTFEQYHEYTRHMGHLPVMTKSYIFGSTIPMPKTDKDGHIHVRDIDQVPGEFAGAGKQSPTLGPGSLPRNR